MDGYFRTEERQKAKNWDMLQQSKAHKASMSRMRNEGRQMANPIRVLCDALEDLDAYVVRFEEDKITISRHDLDRPKLPGCTIAVDVVAMIPLAHGELKPIQLLFDSFRESKKSAASIARELKDIEEDC